MTRTEEIFAQLENTKNNLSTAVFSPSQSWFSNDGKVLFSRQTRAFATLNSWKWESDSFEDYTNLQWRDFNTLSEAINYVKTLWQARGLTAEQACAKLYPLHKQWKARYAIADSVYRLSPFRGGSQKGWEIQDTDKGIIYIKEVALNKAFRTRKEAITFLLEKKMIV